MEGDKLTDEEISESVLYSVKKALGIAPEYDAFDPDIIMHINSSMTTLHQLGVGPRDGFMIEDVQALWTDFLQQPILLNSAKTYIYQWVRLRFDPPGTSFLVTALENQIKEAEWRLVSQVETLIPLRDREESLEFP